MTSLITRDVARELLTLGGRRTTESEIDRFMRLVQDGVPAMPVQMFCSTLNLWAGAYRDPGSTLLSEAEKVERRAVSSMIDRVFREITKSNLLYRLIYQGEAARRTWCPVHKGKWSGCRPPEESGCRGECSSGYNVTGWLRDEK